MDKKNKQSGFLKLIVIIVVILILLAVLNIDLRKIVESDIFQANLSLVIDILLIIWNFIVMIWTNFIKEPAFYIWENLIVPLSEKITSQSTLD